VKCNYFEDLYRSRREALNIDWDRINAGKEKQKKTHLLIGANRNKAISCQM